jgi:hypothetical protein
VTDLRPSIESALGAFGLDATVTPPGGASVPTTVFWLPSVTEQRPSGREHQRAEQLRVLVIPKSAVAQVPRETVIAVPEEEGGAVKNWKVDAADRFDVDHYRAIVVPA